MGDAGGRYRLRELIARYRPQVRADLMERFGVDLAVWWRARRWRALLELIEQLPDASRLNEAIQNDPEQAELIARARLEQDPDKAAPWSPRPSEFDLHANLLRDLIQAVQVNTATTVAAAGGKARTPASYPTPVTEVDKATARLEQAWARSVLARFGFDRTDF